jgi:hypothetical protein
MFLAMRRRLTYTNLAVTFALIFMMSGGAYAANHYLITSTKQIKPSVLKQLTGKSGAAGASGTSGAQGPAGPTGPGGPQGPAGSSGISGESVTSKEVKVGDATHCEKRGGSEFTTGSTKTTACNGKEGSPWTAGGTLPSEKTLKGEWIMPGNAAGVEAVTDSVSFALALAAAPRKHYIRKNGLEAVYNKAGENITPTECLGSAAEPTAKPGNLCVYAANEENTMTQYFAFASIPIICSLDTEGPAGSCLGNGVTSEEASRFGFGIETISEKAGALNVYGTWAVTAE